MHTRVCDGIATLTLSLSLSLSLSTYTQYDEGDLYEHFVQFYKDTLPEFSKAGKVVQFKVKLALSSLFFVIFNVFVTLIMHNT